MGDVHARRLQRRHARHPSRPRRTGDQQLGRSASIRPSRARRRSRTFRRSGSWMPSWRCQATGAVTYGDKGNPTKEELDKTIAQADRAEEGRPLARALEHLRRVGEPDGVRRGGHSVDVVAGGDRGPGAGHQVRLPAAQGRLSRLGQWPRVDEPSRRHQARCGLRVSELVRVRLGRRLHRQAGLLHLGSRDGEEQSQRERVGLLLRWQGGDRGYHQPDRPEDQQRRRRSRRRLL